MKTSLVEITKKYAAAPFLGISLSFLFVVALSSAAPPGSPFNLGETLTPGCAPGDANCTVVTPAGAGDNTDIDSLQMTGAGAGTDQPTSTFRYSRGTTAVPTVAQDDDIIGSVIGQYYDGNSYESAASMQFYANGTPGDGDVPGGIFFSTTPDGSATPVERMVITENGNVGVGASTPIEKLALEADGADADILLRIYEGATSENPTVFFDFADGTAAAPATVADSQTAAHIVGRAWDGADFQELGSIHIQTNAATAAGDTPGKITWFTTPDGSTTPVQRMELDSDGELTLGSTTFGDEELAIGPSEGGSSSDTAISMENSGFVYEIHVEDSNEFVIYQNEDEDSGDSVLMYNGTTQHWGFGTDPDGDEISVDNGASLSAGGVWTDASSRDYKENITNLSLEEALAALKGLEPVSFNYLDEKDEEYLGFIAEDVPEAVARNDRKSLSSMDIVAVLTKVVQNQQDRINDLEQRLQDIEAFMDSVN